MNGQRLDPRQLAAALPEKKEVARLGGRNYSPRLWKILMVVIVIDTAPLIFFPSSWWWLLLIGLVAGSLLSLATDWGPREFLGNLPDNRRLADVFKVEDYVEDEISAAALEPGDRITPSGRWKAAQNQTKESTEGFSNFNAVNYPQIYVNFELIVAIESSSRYSDDFTVATSAGISRTYNASTKFARERVKPHLFKAEHYELAAAVSDISEAVEYGSREPILLAYLQDHYDADVIQRAGEISLAVEFTRSLSGDDSIGPPRLPHLLMSTTDLGRMWLEADRDVRSRAAKDVLLRWLDEQNRIQSHAARIDDFPFHRRAVHKHFLSYRDLIAASHYLRDEGLIECQTLEPLSGVRAWPTARGFACLKAGGDVTEYMKYNHREPEEVYVSVQQINIHGDVVNSNVVAASVIENSSLIVDQANVSNELRTLLSDLHKSVAKLTAELPEDEAELAAHDLEILTAEATSATPRRAFIRRAATGLIELAGTVATAGIPITDLVTKIIALVS